VQRLTHETPDYIAATLWPANRHGLKRLPVDYRIWGRLQDLERVYSSRIYDVTQLKSRLIEEWKHFNQMINLSPIEQSDGDVQVFQLVH